MASLPEIIAPEAVPDDLITVVDEATVRAEVAARPAKVLQPPGLVDRATRGPPARTTPPTPKRAPAAIDGGSCGCSTRGLTRAPALPA